MDPSSSALQRLTRLSPLAEALAAIDTAVRPVTAHEAEPATAVGRVLAADVVPPDLCPVVARALCDGWAVRADAIADAGPYAPVALVPPPAWVEVGDALPPGTDAVLPADAVTAAAGLAEALAPATPGDGVLAAGADARPDRVLVAAGRRLRAIDVPLLQEAGVARVAVRVPRIRIASAYGGQDQRQDLVGPWIARAIEMAGGAPVSRSGSFAAALDDLDADAVIAVGGTGAGHRDAGVRELARVGTVAFHGVGLSPGQTAAFGSVGARAVLLLPGRLDAALAAMLVLGHRLMARLTGATDAADGSTVTLRRKAASTVGIAEVVLVRRVGEGVEPVAANVFPLQALAAADGYIMVPAESEGHPPGAVVEMRALP